MRHQRSNSHGYQALGKGGGGGGHGGGGHGGGGHGGGGHHGGGGFRRGGGGGGGWWGGPGWGWDWGYPWYAEPDIFVIDNSSDPDQIARAMAYIMSLPKAQRAAAYMKIFGTTPPPSVLSDFDASSAVKYAALAVGGYLLYNLIKKR